METCHESVTVPIDRLIELRILILIFSFYVVIFLSLSLSLSLTLCLISFSLFPRSLKLDSKSFKAPHSYLVHPFLDDVQSKHKIFCVVDMCILHVFVSSGEEPLCFDFSSPPIFPSSLSSSRAYIYDSSFCVYISGHHYRISLYIVSTVLCIPRIAGPLFPYSFEPQPSPIDMLFKITGYSDEFQLLI